LIIVASGLRIAIPPDQGPTQASKIAHALTVGCGTYDAERSDLDESDVAVRVLEHLRPLDPRGLSDVRRGDLDRLAARADAMRARAPFTAQAPQGRSLRDRTMRRYLASFGIDSPPKIESDRRDVGVALVEALTHIARIKPRSSLVHVVAAPPDERQAQHLGEAVRRVKSTGAALTWSSPSIELALSAPWDDPMKLPPDDEDPFAPAHVAPPPAAPTRWDELAPIAAAAVRVRARVSLSRREAVLRKLGIRIVRLRHVTNPVTPAATTEKAPG
jgi:hypothetical protein